jgi:hypothetical protein
MRETLSRHAVRCQFFVIPEQPSVIALVVDDSDDDGLASLFAIEQVVPSPRFGGIWRAADGEYPAVSFQLDEHGAGEDSVERRFTIEAAEQALLETIVRVPHYVAIVPWEIAGDASGVFLLPRLAAALFVEVKHRSPGIEALRQSHSD